MFHRRPANSMLRCVARRPRRQHDRGQRVAAFRRALTEWGWRADLGHGRLACRDHHDRRAVLLVLPAEGGAVLIPSRPGPLYLPALTTGALRGVLQTAVLAPDPSVPATERAAMTRRTAWFKAAA
ncbi:hypothetical protein [Labedaea rhizosphaerae]|uniref:Uncharacterized protein n=1 Tax=Labedaea rhizosphaerae TaxID=598644 RepID=A0A4R6SI58_LABRH|nr:hypothetical protein [Labedaea rhizosphaerae]TDQ00638.1 hypothetical protein EV186_102499 [Labedaea rhizosphaerae]